MSENSSFNFYVMSNWFSLGWVIVFSNRFVKLYSIWAVSYICCMSFRKSESLDPVPAFMAANVFSSFARFSKVNLRAFLMFRGVPESYLDSFLLFCGLNTTTSYWLSATRGVRCVLLRDFDFPCPCRGETKAFLPTPNNPIALGEANSSPLGMALGERIVEAIASLSLM